MCTGVVRKAVDFLRRVRKPLTSARQLMRRAASPAELTAWDGALEWLIWALCVMLAPCQTTCAYSAFGRLVRVHAVTYCYRLGCGWRLGWVGCQGACSGSRPRADRPPSTARTVPLMKLASSDSR
jgi:hypothetical protein